VQQLPGIGGSDHCDDVRDGSGPLHVRGLGGACCGTVVVPLFRRSDADGSPNRYACKELRTPRTHKQNKAPWGTREESKDDELHEM